MRGLGVMLWTLLFALLIDPIVFWVVLSVFAISFIVGIIVAIEQKKRNK